jgi:Domain of unknown function (DUF4209)
MEEYKDKVKQLESISYSEYLSEFAGEFKKIRDWAKEKGLVRFEKMAQYEIEVLSLHDQTPIVKINDRGRFIPMIEYKDGTKWPDIENFTGEQIAYYEQRLEETENVFLRARYADFLFEHGDKHGTKNKYEISKILLPSLLETAEKHLEKGNFYLFVSDLARAVEVSLKMGNKEWIEIILKKIESTLHMFDKNKDYRWTLELSRLLRNILGSKLSNLVDENIVLLCIHLLNNGRKSYWDNKEYYMHRKFCEEIIHWKKFKRISKEVEQQLQVEIGRSFEEEAVHQQGREQKSSMVKAHFYELAMRHYANIGRTDKVEEMKILIRKAYKEWEESDELSVVSVEVPIPTHEIENMMRPYLEVDVAESIDMIAKPIDFIPDINNVEELTKELIATSPLYHLVTKGLIDDEKKVAEAKNDEESYQWAFSQNYMLHLQMVLNMVLVPLFDKLMNERGLTSEIIIDQVFVWPLMSEKNKPFVELGIKKFFDGDYVSSIHILVPQFESTLRRMFAAAGYATTSIKKSTAQHEETFNEFLNRDDIKEALGERIHKLIQMVMVDQMGINLRNKVAHGLITFEQCTKDLNLLVIYLFLLLTNYSVVKEKNNASE